MNNLKADGTQLKQKIQKLKLHEAFLIVQSPAFLIWTLSFASHAKIHY